MSMALGLLWLKAVTRGLMNIWLFLGCGTLQSSLSCTDAQGLLRGGMALAERAMCGQG